MTIRFFLLLSILGSFAVLNGQAKWQKHFSLESGPSLMLFALKENPFLQNRTTVLVHNAWGHHQRIGMQINKSQHKAFAILGLQHNVNILRVDYLKFDNPLIKEGSAFQKFDLRYLTVPLGIGRRMKTGLSGEWSIFLFSEIMATYRLRCVDSGINVIFNDNTRDNLASLKSIYEYSSNNFNNLGAAIGYRKKLTSRTSFIASIMTVWQPRAGGWFDFGASMFAGGQLEQVRIASTVWRNNLSVGLSLDL